MNFDAFYVKLHKLNDGLPLRAETQSTTKTGQPQMNTKSAPGVGGSSAGKQKGRNSLLGSFLGGMERKRKRKGDLDYFRPSIKLMTT